MQAARRASTRSLVAGRPSSVTSNGPRSRISIRLFVASIDDERLATGLGCHCRTHQTPLHVAWNPNWPGSRGGRFHAAATLTDNDLRGDGGSRAAGEPRPRRHCGRRSPPARRPGEPARPNGLRRRRPGRRRRGAPRARSRARAGPRDRRHSNAADADDRRARCGPCDPRRIAGDRHPRPVGARRGRARDGSPRERRAQRLSPEKPRHRRRPNSSRRSSGS